MDISNLIKEAKPLYFKRKRRRRMIKGVITGLTACLFLGVFMMPKMQPASFQQTNEFYAFLYDDDLYNQKMQLLTQIDTYLPMDEYEEIAVLL